MYLRECLIENVGPITTLDVSLSLDNKGNPKPLILVGKNGTGKTIFLAYILDALAELAKITFRDIVKSEAGYSPYLKMSSGGDTHSLLGNSLSLLEFSNAENKFCYVEKIGNIDYHSYTTKLNGRFESVKSWQDNEEMHKLVQGDQKLIQDFFEKEAICFFPSSRHERPHWLNASAVKDEMLFGNSQRIRGELGKPLIVERAAEDNRQWLMDVFLDSLVDVDLVPIEPASDGSPQSQWIIRSNTQDKQLLKIGRSNIESLLRLVLEDETAQLVLNYRNSVHGRLSIHLGNGIVIPSLSHLSAGQALLFNLFSTIIRYADRSDINKSFSLNEICGIIVIDEIDAHLHADLQHEVLPKLVKLFPKVQFVVTSHSPLFLLGMEREFGADGIQILEMPLGQQITTERFGEFLKSFAFYRQTQIFENTLEKQILAASKPLILTEGQTDAAHIKAFLELWDHSDILNQLDICEVGMTGKGGSQGSGYTGLDSAYKFLKNNQNRFPRQILFLYDCDTNKNVENTGSLSIRCIPQNLNNSRIVKGIENLFPSELFDESRFYQESKKATGYGKDNIIIEFKKQEFCDYICKERKNKQDFYCFEESLISIIKEFLGTS
jgi:AAA domain, putative AbiEii toxin, Type IV TA system